MMMPVFIIKDTVLNSCVVESLDNNVITCEINPESLCKALKAVVGLPAVFIKLTQIGEVCYIIA